MIVTAKTGSALLTKVPFGILYPAVRRRIYEVRSAALEPRFTRAVHVYYMFVVDLSSAHTVSVRCSESQRMLQLTIV